MSDRRATHSTVRALGSMALIGALLIGATGCSWRLEAQPVVYPSADAVTLERDAAAQREQDVLDFLENGAGDGISASDLESIEAVAAPAHLDALGGVYVATPAPSPSPFPGLLDQSVLAARDGAFETAQQTTDANLAFLQSSIGLSHAFALWWAQNANLAANLEPSPEATDATPSATAHPAISEEPAPLIAVERPVPSGVDFGSTFTPTNADAFATATYEELALAHDEARFLYEVIAARAAGVVRDNALARRDIHAARAEQFAALADGSDPRQPIYVIAPAAVDTAQARGATARDAEFALGATYAAMLDGVGPDDRGWVLNAAFDAYAAGALQLGFVPADFPVLPGVATPTP